MAVDYLDQADGIDFGVVSGISGLSAYTVSYWANLDTIKTSDYNQVQVSCVDQSGTTNGFYIFSNNIAYSNALAFTNYFSDTAGLWITNNYFTTSTNIFVALTHNNTSTSNNPSMYKNGLATSVTELTAPVGTASTSDLKLVLGNRNDDVSAFARAMDGRLQDVRIYSRILSADEIYSLYTSRCINFLRYGLVFHAPLIGASGLTKFDGTDLGATNYLYDEVTGTTGTPNGSPVGVGNTIQRVY